MQFDLVTPERLVLSKDVSQVIAPGTEGSFGAMEGHQPLISTLKAGELVVMSGTESESYFVSGGFVDVTPEKVTVLAEEALLASTLNKAEIEKELAAVNHEVKGLKKTHNDDVKLNALLEKEDGLRVKLALAS